MITTHQIFRAKTYDGSDIEFEVNFSDHAKVRDSQVVRLRYKDVEIDISQKELVSILMMIGTAENQKKLIPMKLTKIRKMERLLTFDWVSSKDYRKGDKITVTAPFIDTMEENEVVMSGTLDQRTKRYDKKQNVIGLSRP